MVRMKSVGLLLLIITLFSVGVMCLFFLEQTRGIAIKVADWAYASKNHPLKTLVRSNNYLNMLRMVGAIALFTSFFLIWAWIKNL